MSSQIERCLDVMELLADSPNGLRLSEITERVSMPKSAAHRLLTALASRGFARLDPLSQRYLMGLKLVVLGTRFLSGTGITDLCQPELDRLAQTTGELVRLAIVENDDLIWVAEAQGARRGLRYDSVASRIVKMHCTATGKAWLATLDEETALRIVLQRGFGPPEDHGPRAVRTVTELVAELDRVRARGYAMAYEEGEPGMSAIAAAIANPRPGGPYVGTISVAGPSVRMTPDQMERMAPEVLRAAEAATQLWPIGRSGAARPAEDMQRIA